MPKYWEKLTRNYSGYLLPFLFLMLIGGIYLSFVYQKGDWVLFFCNHFNSLVYSIFKYVTFLGEPQVLMPMMLIFFALRMGVGALLFSSWFSASMITIVLKNIINNHRPAYFFKETFIECAGNIELMYNHSMPSGHTTAAFAFFAGMAFISKSKPVQFLFFISALFVGLSRMVLFHHFFSDVYFGALIGGLTPFIILYLYKEKNLFNFEAWKNKSLLSNPL